ncbi:unnamed protein product, partial [Rotaria magnacalcarata]
MVAIQEHRWQTSEETSTSYGVWKDTKWRFEYSSATPEGQGGVGLLMNPRMSAFFDSSEKISGRIMMVHFKGNPAITIIIVYAPTEDKSDIEKDTFYDDLEKCTQDIPPHNVLILAGDFNARIGIDSHKTNPRVIGKHTYHHSTDDNGNRLVNYCEACNIRSTQSRFPQPQSRSWTWLHPNNNSKAQLDHILINGKWINSIRNVRAYNTVELNSDHRIVSAKLMISLRTPKDNKLKRIKFDWNKLKDSSTLQSQFNIEVRNRFEILGNINPNNDIQTKYDNFLNSIQETTANLVGKIKRKTNNNWVSNDTTNLLQQRNRAKNNFKRNPTTENKKTWHTLNERLDSSYQNDKIIFLEDKLEQLKQAAVSNQLRTTWSLIDEISGKRRYNNASRIKRTDGTKINSTNELMNEWKTYFENLLNVKSDASEGNEPIPPASEDLPIHQGPITAEEVEQAVKQLKDGKSPGLDYAITPEALKYGGKWIINQLCNICNDIYENQRTPTQFNTNIIIPVQKKGDKTLMTNYRGISLMSVAAKTYNRILLNRIRGPLDPFLRVNQAGFRSGRSCIDQIHVIRRILEGAIEKQLPIFITFVDFMKAFDSINRQIMFDILRHYGVPLKIVKAIEAIYHHSKSVVLVDGNVSKEFNVTTGVLQGDTLAPFLFIVVIDYIMKNVQLDHANEKGESGFITNERQSRRQPATTINDLEFADDIALFESSFERAQSQLTQTIKWANKVGLQINTKKTQALTNQTTNNRTLKVNEQDIEWINNFKYLGAMIS